MFHCYYILMIISNADFNDVWVCAQDGSGPLYTTFSSVPCLQAPEYPGSIKTNHSIRLHDQGAGMFVAIDFWSYLFKSFTSIYFPPHWYAAQAWLHIQVDWLLHGPLGQIPWLWWGSLLQRLPSTSRTTTSWKELYNTSSGRRRRGEESRGGWQAREWTEWQRQESQWGWGQE